ncbi:MAG: sugar transferase [Candidatus Dormibacteraeota bacterium]|nr:sugar transferase [Candidatus Dormibacteraeota bacterium]
MSPSEVTVERLSLAAVSAPAIAEARPPLEAIRSLSMRGAAVGILVLFWLAFILVTQVAPLWVRVVAGGLIGSVLVSSTLVRALRSPLRVRVETLVPWATAAAFASAVAVLVSQRVPGQSGGLGMGLAVAIEALIAVVLLTSGIAFAAQPQVRVLLVGSSEFQARAGAEASARRRRVAAAVSPAEVRSVVTASQFDEIAVEAGAFARVGELNTIARRFSSRLLVEDPARTDYARNLFDPPIPPLGRLVKRVLDVSIAVAAVTVTLPVLAVAAVVIRRESAGPAVYRSRRVGDDGRPFTMYKLRTMVTGNDDSQHRAYVANYIRGEAVPHSGMFKLNADPRVTRVGNTLRRLSIDELPQLINVIRGDMSLIGPRPPLPHEVDEYDAAACQRLRAKPGLTGLWQVRGRCVLSFADQVALDREYWNTWSLWGDMRILMQTPRAVLSRRGAR